MGPSLREFAWLPCERRGIADAPLMVKSAKTGAPCNGTGEPDHEEPGMNWELFAAFFLASAVLALIPGPMVGVITSTGIRYGTRAALHTVAGGVAAMAIHMIIVVAATASIFLFLETSMPVIRWAGVAYLAYLGADAIWKSFRPAPDKLPAPPRRAALFTRGLAVNVSNPKTLAFIAAFFPQFIDANLPLGPQLILLGITYALVVGAIDVGWAFVSGKARWLFESDGARRWKERAAGTALLGAAAGLASIRTG